MTSELELYECRMPNGHIVGQWRMRADVETRPDAAAVTHRMVFENGQMYFSTDLDADGYDADGELRIDWRTGPDGELYDEWRIGDQAGVEWPAALTERVGE